MKWCGLTTTKHHIKPNLCGRKLNLFILGKKAKKRRCEYISCGTKQVIFFLVLAWNFEFVVFSSARVHWLHMTATGNWLQQILHFQPNSNDFYTSSWPQYMTRQTDNKMRSIKLLGNCYLFEWDQCAISWMHINKKAGEKKQRENIFSVHQLKIDKNCLGKRWHTFHTRQYMVADSMRDIWPAAMNCPCLSPKKNAVITVPIKINYAKNWNRSFPTVS